MKLYVIFLFQFFLCLTQRASSTPVTIKYLNQVCSERVKEPFLFLDDDEYQQYEKIIFFLKIVFFKHTYNFNNFVDALSLFLKDENKRNEFVESFKNPKKKRRHVIKAATNNQLGLAGKKINASLVLEVLDSFLKKFDVSYKETDLKKLLDIKTWEQIFGSEEVISIHLTDEQNNIFFGKDGAYNFFLKNIIFKGIAINIRVLVDYLESRLHPDDKKFFKRANTIYLGVNQRIFNTIKNKKNGESAKDKFFRFLYFWLGLYLHGKAEGDETNLPSLDEIITAAFWKKHIRCTYDSNISTPTQ